MNVNYHGRLRKPQDLSRMTLPHSKLHTRPQQLVVKDKKGTVIFFNTGKFRVMGCIDAIEASFLAFKYTLKIDNDDFPELYSQSYTSRAKLGYDVNLRKLAQCEKTLFEPELFSAVRMCKFKPLSVNVFSTGSIVVCGLKEPEDMYAIINEIDALCKCL